MPVLKSSVLDQFATDGYVATGSLLTADEIDAFAPAIDRAVARRTADETRALADKSEYEQSFVQCMRLWETDPEVAPLTFHPVLAQAAAELLGVDRVRLWQDQALYKEPGGRITDAHQDAPFWPIGDAPLVSAWIPLAGPSPSCSSPTGIPERSRGRTSRSIGLVSMSASRCKETACHSRGLVNQATFQILQPRSANGQDDR